MPGLQQGSLGGYGHGFAGWAHLKRDVFREGAIPDTEFVQPLVGQAILPAAGFSRPGYLQSAFLALANLLLAQR